MKLTAMIAFNLAVLRFVPLPILSIPIFVFLIVLLELAIVHALFGRPLRTFYFVFLLVGVLLTAMITYLFFGFTSMGPGSLSNLETAIKTRLGLTSQSNVIALYSRIPNLAAADGFLTCLLAILPAWAAGLIAAKWMGRRAGREREFGQCSLGFLTGSIVGAIFFSIVAQRLGLVISPSRLAKIYLPGILGSAFVSGVAIATVTWRRLRKRGTAFPDTR
jgi:hypothetical protein